MRISGGALAAAIGSIDYRAATMHGMSISHVDVNALLKRRGRQEWDSYQCVVNQIVY